MATATDNPQHDDGDADGDGDELLLRREAAALLATQAAEPILRRTDDRFHFRVTDEALRRRYDDALSVFWTPREIETHADVSQWASLPDEERRFIGRVLAFFATADGIVFENVAVNFADEVTIPEARYFYALQGFMENIHAETYMKLLTAYVTDPDERRAHIDAIHAVPSIRAKAEWALRHFDRERPFCLRLIAFAAVEGIFFCGAFASIFWLKHTRRGMLEALTFSNQLIARDESLHTEFATLLFGRLERRPSFALARRVVEEAVELEDAFTRDSLRVPLIGIDAARMGEYIRYMADRLMQQLGYPRIYGSANPFPWMELQSMRVTTNFFEGRVAEYALPEQGSFSTTAVF